jgi:hypothetical protein
LKVPVFPGCQTILPGGSACTLDVKMRPVCLVMDGGREPTTLRAGIKHPFPTYSTQVANTCQMARLTIKT